MISLEPVMRDEALQAGAHLIESTRKVHGMQVNDTHRQVVAVMKLGGRKLALFQFAHQGQDFRVGHD